ncbi:MAG: ribose transport system permease protein [Solirubrobacteraceae bacterium]|jgi:ribose transport system permease protein|nr:ribose transport system permease protein [Solirubrobacteraceae bacterium]
MNVATTEPQLSGLGNARAFAMRAFLTVGLIPFLLVILIVVFASIEPRFLSSFNILNIGRQATYLMVATMGQMLYLLTRNYDLSNGATIALTSVVTALVMTWSGWGDSTAAAIAGGCLAGVGVGVAVGLVNGAVVSRFNISSFMVTLGMSSVAFGVALLLSSGVPISGLPAPYVQTLGTGRWLGIPVPLYITLVIGVLFYVLLNWTKLGRHAYAIGGNAKAARVSGVRVGRDMLLLLVIGSALAAIAGLMLTARLSSGEANIGSDFPLQSIAAAVLGGVSLFGGEGRLSGAVIGVLFIVVLNNGMDLIRVESYVQLVVLGALLIVALIVDRARIRLQR